MVKRIIAAAILTLAVAGVAITALAAPASAGVVKPLCAGDEVNCDG